MCTTSFGFEQPTAGWSGTFDGCSIIVSCTIQGIDHEDSHVVCLVIETSHNNIFAIVEVRIANFGEADDISAAFAGS